MSTEKKQPPLETGIEDERDTTSENIGQDKQETGSTVEQATPRRMFRPPQPGTSIWRGTQRYLIGEKINEGHFGQVYHCSDGWGNLLVAKVLSPRGMSYDKVKAHWLDEAQKLLTLRHPNTTYVHDILEYEDTFYIIMEYCAFTIHELINTPSFNGRVWLMPIARCVLQAVDFMHVNGYVHKDLHHKNIFASFVPDEISREKDPAVVFKVGDFGISRLEGDIDPANTILAPWMMPPEGLNPNEFGLIGYVTDIYHIGLVFLSLLEGQIREFTHEEILAGAPRQAAEKLDSPYAAAIAKALRRRTNLRTQSALEFWRDLQAAGVESITR